MEPEATTARCHTCGTAIVLAPVFDAEEGVYLAPRPYCSIHCEHYAGLQRAAVRDDA